MTSKKKSINLNIKISNRWLYAIVVLIVLLILGLSVWAYGTNVPSTMGHSFGELEGVQSTLPSCSTGQVLQRVGSSWSCGNLPSASIGTLSCTTAVGSFSSSSIATCTSGTLTGGGCITATGISPNIYITAPSGNGWQCQLSGGNSVTAYARCCRIV